MPYLSSAGRSNLRRRWAAFALALATTAAAPTAHAQLGPFATHHGARRSDTGATEGAVDTAGRFDASVPLALPTARGGLTLPVEIVYGGHGFGAAGRGWDVPVSFVRHHATVAHRRPFQVPDAPPVAQERLVLSLAGASHDMIVDGDHWRARANAPELLLRQTVDGYTAEDGAGRFYVFEQPPGLSDPDLWLLTRIEDRTRSNHVDLAYMIGQLTTTGGEQALEVELTHVDFDYDPGDTCPKHRVSVHHNTLASSPYAIWLYGDELYGRSRTVSEVVLFSRTACNAGWVRLHRTILTYAPDLDTGLPRLVKADVQGQAGTPEESVTLPVAAYGYGSATTGGKSLKFLPAPAIALPPDVPSNVLAKTVRSSSYDTWQTLQDMNGDGRADAVYVKDPGAPGYPEEPTVWIAKSAPSASGTTLGAGSGLGALTDGTLTHAPFDSSEGSGHKEVWRRVVDVNGDGRLDVIDADALDDAWVIYLNTPSDDAPAGVTWVEREWDTTSLRDRLLARGHAMPLSNRVPLERRVSWRSETYTRCFVWGDGGWEPYEGGQPPPYPCDEGPIGLADVGRERTFTEWKLDDVNGDGYLDFLANSAPVDEHVGGCPYGDVPPQHQGNIALRCGEEHAWHPGDSNHVDVFYNVAGIRFDWSEVFSAPVNIGSQCGVERWAQDGDYSMRLDCGFADVNGDGIPDRVEYSGNETAVSLGTGHGFTGEVMAIPGPAARVMTGQYVCETEPPPDPLAGYSLRHSHALIDLTGDGIPDHVASTTPINIPEYTIAVGTGAGFAAPIPIEVVGNYFALSSGSERCDGTSSSTTKGLFDLNGDARPDLVAAGPQTGSLSVWQIVGNGLARGVPEAGRLVDISNGYGQRTHVTYASAKEDWRTAHQVPFPEIAVTKVETLAEDGIGTSLAPTYYAYGDASLIFDPYHDLWTMAAYGRTATLTGPTFSLGGQNPTISGRATITDTLGLKDASQGPATTDFRFGRFLLAGQTAEVHSLAGTFAKDPNELLTVQVQLDSRLRAGVHFGYATHADVHPPPPLPNLQDCTDVEDPYDPFAASVTVLGFCATHGFAIVESTDTWRGDAPIPSTYHVSTGTHVLAFDGYARPTMVQKLNDTARTDDDVCVETTYASAVGAVRVLDAIASERVRDCTKVQVVFAGTRWVYDDLPEGQVEIGLPSAEWLERYDPVTGALLEQFSGLETTYDAFGNVTQSTRTREDGAQQWVQSTYDAFGLAVDQESAGGNGVPTLVTDFDLDPLTLATLGTFEPNGERRGVVLDGFGRVRQRTVAVPGGPIRIAGLVDHLGFSEGDPGGRRVRVQSFRQPLDAVPVAPVADALDVTTWLDELGRAYTSEQLLGTDYAGAKMIKGARSFDAFGRVAFEADAYPSTQDGATAYGTSYHYHANGDLWCSVRGNGPTPLLMATDEVQEIYPTCLNHYFVGHQEIVEVSTPSSLLSGSPQSGVIYRTTSSGAGWTLRRDTWQGTTRLEHESFAYDRLGQAITLVRYENPATGTGPISWQMRQDSLGQLMTIDEPGLATRSMSYDHWGKLTSSKWIGGGHAHDLVNEYDALGRRTRVVEKQTDVEVPGTARTFHYDAPSGNAAHHDPTYLLGRLSWADGAAGAVYFGYDGHGRVAAESRVGLDSVVVRQSFAHRLDGSLSSVAFRLPDTGYAPEVASYGYDTAGRIRSVSYADENGTSTLFNATAVDAWGRYRNVAYGDAVTFSGSYRDIGRREALGALLSGPQIGSQIQLGTFDPDLRERSRQERQSGANPTVWETTSSTYDALGRLASSTRKANVTLLAKETFAYDALGNLREVMDQLGTNDIKTTLEPADHDKICRVAYGDVGPPPKACNWTYDALGDVTSMQAPGGATRTLTYDGAGKIKTIAQGAGTATFKYDAFGEIGEVDVTGLALASNRHDRRYGALVERADEVVLGLVEQFWDRKIPGPDGLFASKRGHGAGAVWIYGYGELRGSRHFFQSNGSVAGDVKYRPFGGATTTGAAPGSRQYTKYQWNAGDALAGFGVVQVGARIYDPAVGRFLQRDPTQIVRTATWTHPYAFAANDPLNRADPSGRDPVCSGQECQGGGTGSIPTPGDAEFQRLLELGVLFTVPLPAGARPARPKYEPPPAPRLSPQSLPTQSGRRKHPERQTGGWMKVDPALTALEFGLELGLIVWTMPVSPGAIILSAPFVPNDQGPAYGPNRAADRRAAEERAARPKSSTFGMDDPLRIIHGPNSAPPRRSPAPGSEQRLLPRALDVWEADTLEYSDETPRPGPPPDDYFAPEEWTDN